MEHNLQSDMEQMITKWKKVLDEERNTDITAQTKPKSKKQIQIEMVSKIASAVLDICMRTNLDNSAKLSTIEEMLLNLSTMSVSLLCEAPKEKSKETKNNFDPALLKQIVTTNDVLATQITIMEKSVKTSQKEAIDLQARLIDKEKQIIALQEANKTIQTLQGHNQSL